MEFPWRVSLLGYGLMGMSLLCTGGTSEARIFSSSDHTSPLMKSQDWPSDETATLLVASAPPVPSSSEDAGNFFFSPTSSSASSTKSSVKEIPEVEESLKKEVRPESHSSEVEEAIPVMDETVVEGSTPEIFDDPFEDPFSEGLQVDINDPWEGFNSSMFDLNYNLDQYFFKPIATGYNWFIPPDAQDSIANAFHNVAIVPRLMNNIFQGKMDVAYIELKRFFLNSTLGIGGFFDVAKYMFDTEAPGSEDTGQTLAVYGVDPGPYLVLPFLGPTTVRDGFGQLGDALLDPLNYFVPFVPNISKRAGELTNERSRNLDFFEGLEESTIDLYGAVRSGYFERRSKAINQ